MQSLRHAGHGGAVHGLLALPPVLRSPWARGHDALRGMIRPALGGEAVYAFFRATTPHRTPNRARQPRTLPAEWRADMCVTAPARVCESREVKVEVSRTDLRWWGRRGLPLVLAMFQVFT